MFLAPAQPSAPFDANFFPQQVLLLSVGENMMPMGYWTVISKEPFRFLICMQLGNYTLELLRQHREAALHCMPWSERERVIKAGHLSGRDGPKAPRLGFNLIPAAKLAHTQLVEGAHVTYETVVFQELEGLSHEFALFVLDVVATHGKISPLRRSPILFLSQKDFATLGEKYHYRPPAW
ncbi:MAG TPA: flavin reductase [Chloroflexi bacterium]|nr:flavin reductase [Chloroflexota bacterium]HBY08631.1 flavin reductase [Chloroflexota bacterium]